MSTVNIDKKVIKRLRNLPEPMEPKDIQEFLGLSKNSTYKLIEEKQFHSVRVGKLWKIPKRTFVKWYLGI
jgi:excisionase family DNA binding protein